jgi:tetratricopeptide (TPR) repeat protein/tRNA A-37 threonylcarbamoyl transferase component Bud32
VRELGRGAFGVVYEAEQTALGRRVALKALRARWDGDAAARERLRREARAAATIDHPAAVRVHDVVESGGATWIVMELVDGPSLAEAVRRAAAGEPGGLPSDPRARARAAALGFAELADAAHAAHRRGVVHRDIKPSNVLVAPDGTLKLADFGLAALPGVERLTLDGTPVGSPASMAPEQARGDADAVGPRTDVYALGAALYAALTLRAPFRGGTVVETLAQVARGPFPDPRVVEPATSDALAAAVLRAAAHDPAARFEDAAAFAAALRAAVAPPAAVAPRRRAYRRLAPVLAALALALALAGREAWRSRAVRVVELEVAAASRRLLPLLMTEGFARDRGGADAREFEAELARLRAVAPDHPRTTFFAACGAAMRDERGLARALIGTSDDRAPTPEGAALRAFLARPPESSAAWIAESERRGPPSTESLLLRAVFAQQTEPAAARRAADEALRRPDLDARFVGAVRRIRGVAAAAAGDWNAAADDLDAARRLAPEELGAATLHAVFVARAGRRDEARARFEEILRLAGTDVRARLRVHDPCAVFEEHGWAEEALGPEPPPASPDAAAWAFRRVAAAARRVSRPEDAAIVERLYDAHAADGEIAAAAGSYWARVRDLRRAHAAFDRAAAAEREPYDAPRAKARAFAYAGEPDVVRTAAAAAVAAGSASPAEAALWEGRAYGVRRDHEGAVRALTVSLGLQEAPVARQMRAMALVALGRLGDALVDAKAAADAAPEIVDYVAVYANLLGAAGRTDEAVAYLRAAAGRGMRHALLSAELGRGLARLGARAEAAEAFAEAVRIDPRQGDAHFELAFALDALGRESEVAPALRRGFDESFFEPSLVLRAARRLLDEEEERDVEPVLRGLLGVAQRFAVPVAIATEYAALLARLGAGSAARAVLSGQRVPPPSAPPADR